MLGALVTVGERVLLDVCWIHRRVFLGKVKLAVYIEVVHLLQGHALLCLGPLLLSLFII